MTLILNWCSIFTRVAVSQTPSNMISTLTSTWSDLRSMNFRQLVLQLIGLGLIVTSALVIWKSLMIITGSDSPVVVVLSGSMEPAFCRGDILFLHLARRSTMLGEIVVFNIKGAEIRSYIEQLGHMRVGMTGDKRSSRKATTITVMTPSCMSRARIGFRKITSWVGPLDFSRTSGG